MKKTNVMNSKIKSNRLIHTFRYLHGRMVLTAVCGIISVSLLITGCVDYGAEEFTGKILPRVSGYTTGVTNDWLYFNLRTGEVFNRTMPNRDISEGDQKERTDWDLAFCGYRLRTNSGTSGIGQGGAIDLGYGTYDKWTSVSQLPANAEWIVDTDTDVYVTMSQNDWNKYLIEHNLDFKDNPWFDPNNGPQKTLTSANRLLANSMEFSGPPPVYLPAFHTYVVRSADGGRYFKLQIISWYNTNTEIGDTGGQISYYCDELQP